MTKSNKILNRILIIFIFSILAALLIYTLIFLFTTDDMNTVIKDLNSKSSNDNPNFTCQEQATIIAPDDESSEFDNYVFFVHDNEKEKQYQEIGIYKKVYYLFSDYYRLAPVTNTAGITKSDQSVGTLGVSLNKNNGNETKTQIFYSDNNQIITKVKYRITNNGEIYYENTIELGGSLIIFIVDNLGEQTIGEYLVVSEANFYDEDSNLIFQYKA